MFILLLCLQQEGANDKASESWNEWVAQCKSESNQQTEFVNPMPVQGRISWIDERGIIVNIGSGHGASSGQVLDVRRHGRHVGTLILGKVAQIHSWAEPFSGSERSQFRKADSVESSDSAIWRPQVVAYALTVGPVTATSSEQTERLIDLLDVYDLETRLDAVDGLLQLGYPALLALKKLDFEELSPEASVRVKYVLATLSPLDRLVRAPQLDRDVNYLSGMLGYKDKDIRARAHGKLRKLLGNLPIFKSEGFPPNAPDLPRFLKKWWSLERAHFSWDTQLSQYQESDRDR